MVPEPFGLGRVLRDKDGFAEWAEVHGNYYGTPVKALEGALSRGLDVLLDIDTHGARQLRQRYPEAVSVFVFTPTREGAYSRMFAPEHGVTEDPATGSLTGPLAAFMMRHRLVSSASGTRFVSEQGVKMQRRSILHVHVRGEAGADGIDVGGHVVPLVEATMII